MSVASIADAVKARDEADRAVKVACAEAATAGVPISKIARAAGVTRVTAYSWVTEGSSKKE